MHTCSTSQKKMALMSLVKFLTDKEPEGIDFLINNAGAAWGAPFDEYPVDGWDKVVDINLKSPFS